MISRIVTKELSVKPDKAKLLKRRLVEPSRGKKRARKRKRKLPGYPR